jgi:asparagine synthase (glutamine-hydrolysing)
MCGFVGVMSKNKAMLNYNVLKSMINTIDHRGPDDSGFWSNQNAGISLGHRRLSILDLSSAGYQPMRSPSGHYILVFNGEIYNHLEIRNLLGKHSWIGTSDTETLLTAIENWGIHKTIEICIGMFAFAIWDNKKQELILGRDRMGEKPIYYGWQSKNNISCFLFGSELKALKNHPSFLSKINRQALSLFMQYSYVPTPYSIYQNVFKLKPGHLLKVSLDKQEPTIEPYWSFMDVAKSSYVSKLYESKDNVVDKLESLLKSVIKQKMVADVPVGAFLSGGVDSSTIAAIMQSQSNIPINTFTIGFTEKIYNEATQAKAIANYLGTKHTELYVTPQQALEVIPDLPNLYCEPFADSSQIPTFLVSKLAREKVKVAITGDAGDELFGGYNRYVLTKKFWRKISNTPVWARSFIASSIKSLSPNSWNIMANSIQSLTPRSLRLNNLGEKLHKAAKAMTAEKYDDFYLDLVTHCNPEEIVIGNFKQRAFFDFTQSDFTLFDDVEKMMIADTMSYLPDDILVKVDRASMAVSLESRIPFLDHRVVDFAWRVPQSMKINKFTSKWILREILYKHVPKHLTQQPKMGFSVPIDSWLRGPLKDWAETLLDENRLTQEGFFHPEPIRNKWLEHLSGKKNWQHFLWNVLMFQSWLSKHS